MSIDKLLAITIWTCAVSGTAMILAGIWHDFRYVPTGLLAWMIGIAALIYRVERKR